RCDELVFREGRRADGAEAAVVVQGREPHRTVDDTLAPSCAATASSLDRIRRVEPDVGEAPPSELTTGVDGRRAQTAATEPEGGVSKVLLIQMFLDGERVSRRSRPPRRAQPEEEPRMSPVPRIIVAIDLDALS